MLSVINQGLGNVAEKRQPLQTRQGVHNNNHDPSLLGIRTIQITLFQNSFSDLVQLVCREVSQVQ